MANKYTSLDSVLQDYQAYVKLRNGGQLSMADIPIIAVNRWLNYFVAKWDIQVRQQLKDSFVGDDVGLTFIKSLGDDVLTQKLSPTSPLNPFLNATKLSSYKYIIDTITLSQLDLSPDEQDTANQEQQRIINLQITDFREMSQFLKRLACNSSQLIGLGDVDGVEVQGFSVVEAQRTYFTSDAEQILLLLETADEIDGIVFDLKNRFDTQPNLLQFAASNIQDGSDVSITQSYRSAIAVPFRGTLQQMAKDFLGDSDRFLELVTINNLQAPYVDLVGQKLLMSGPGIKNFVRIPNTLANFVRVGVKIGLGSLSQREEFRQVERVIDQGDGNLTLALTGEQNLDKFKVTDKAFVRVYKPNTVNERSLILIPLDITSPNARKTLPSADALRRLDQALLDFGVDVKRDENTNGFVIGSDGDFQIIYGIPAVRQAVLSVLRTSQNELPFHPEYGVPLAATIGSRFLGTIGEGAAIGNVITDAIQVDGRYDSVILKDIQVTPTSTSISLLVTLPGSNVLIPLDFVS